MVTQGVKKIIIRHVIEMAVNPFFVCLLLFFIFLIFLCLHGNTPLVRNGFILVLILLLLFSTGWLPKILSHKLESQYPVVTKVDSHIHWIVVFSGGKSEAPNMPPNSLLNSVSLDRLVEGVRLYRLLPHAKLLLSGGGENIKIAEATRLSQVVAWFDIPKTNIVLETTSVNTADEARAIKPIIKEEPFYLVTSAIHMPRAMALCRAQGLHPIAAPTDFTSYWENGWERMVFPNSYNLAYMSIAMHELLGRVANFFEEFISRS